MDAEGRRSKKKGEWGMVNAGTGDRSQESGVRGQESGDRGRRIRSDGEEAAVLEFSGLSEGDEGVEELFDAGIVFLRNAAAKSRMRRSTIARFI